MLSLEEKLGKLKEDLRNIQSMAIAFSSGVDSTFLLQTAVDVLGDKVLAITASSCSFPQRELQEAKSFCEARGIKHIVIEANELEMESFRQNPSNRCYICKKALFEKIIAVAAQHGITAVAEGSNVDDLGDYRPGLQAIKELGVLSPLRQAGLHKAEIRQLLQQMNLPTAHKPSFACLSSRVPYGEEITKEKLSMVEEAEQFLMDMGLAQVRVRIHSQASGGYIARIEVDPSELGRLIAEETRQEINFKFKKLGFSYVALDLQGYRTGSMNETLA